MLKSLRLFFRRGPIGILVTAVSGLITAVAVVQFVRSSGSPWMWLFFAAFALVCLSFWRFHEARMAETRAVDPEHQKHLRDIAKSLMRNPMHPPLGDRTDDRLFKAHFPEIEGLRSDVRARRDAEGQARKEYSAWLMQQILERFPQEEGWDVNGLVHNTLAEFANGDALRHPGRMTLFDENPEHPTLTWKTTVIARNVTDPAERTDRIERVNVWTIEAANSHTANALKEAEDERIQAEERVAAALDLIAKGKRIRWSEDCEVCAE